MTCTSWWVCLVLAGQAKHFKQHHRVTVDKMLYKPLLKLIRQGYLFQCVICNIMYLRMVKYPRRNLVPSAEDDDDSRMLHFLLVDDSLLLLTVSIFLYLQRHENSHR